MADGPGAALAAAILRGRRGCWRPWLGGRRRRRARLRARGEFGEAVDRLFLDRVVDAGLGVECEQFAKVCGQPILNPCENAPVSPIVRKHHDEGMRGSWTI